MIEQVKEKLKALAEQREQMIANLHAISGAEQVLRELLSAAEKEATSEQ